jgi:hypothetical protein
MMKDFMASKSDYMLPGAAAKQTPFLIAGVIGLVVVMISGAVLSPERMWAALLLNVFMVFSIALGGIAFSGMQDVVGAVWGRPIKRIHEAFSAFIPFACVFFIVFYLCIAFDLLGARNVYPWMIDSHMLDHFWGKKTWLQIQPFAWRGIFAVALIWFFSCWQLKVSTDRDQNYSQEKAELAKEQLRFWCAPVLIIYALAYSLLCFDLLMSLAPLWFSTLWGGFLFAVMMQTLMATLLISFFLLRGTKIGDKIMRQQFHDVGKMMHGFSIFFAYLTFAHVLTYWFANMPETTEYYIHRIQPGSPWLYIVIIAPFFSFLIPLYTLIFRAAKWTKSITLPIATMILVAQWFLYVLIVIPEVEGKTWFGFWADLAGLIAVLGFAVFAFFRFAAKHPLIGVGDPLLPQAYEQH